MIRVMFVCLGNICRSPVAEYIFKDMVEKCGKQNEFVISSAATFAGMHGEPIYPQSRDTLQKRGISCSAHRSKPLDPDMYEKYDYFIGMEERNARAMTRIFGGDPNGKIKNLADFTESPHDIADPYYTRDFDTAYNDIYEGCEGFLEYLYKRGDLK